MSEGNYLLDGHFTGTCTGVCAVHPLATRSRGDRDGRGRVRRYPDSSWRALQPFHGAVRVYEGHHEREREPRHEVSPVKHCDYMKTSTYITEVPME